MTEITRAEISVCIICRNEAPRLAKCLEPLRPYVQEIIVVDTGSTDDTPEIASKYADRVELYTECNNPDTNLIEDFSKARNYSFSLATQPWILWVDADDVVVGAENLLRLTEEYRRRYGDKPGFYLFPYEYAHDHNGKCTLRHYRERLLSPPSAFKFVNEVHEVCVPIDPFNSIQEKRDDVIIKHNRSDKPVYEPTRNLRILKRMYEKYGDSDARHLYYLGLEYTNTGDLPNGVKFLEKYISLSGWDDEKCMALMKLCEIHCNMGELDLMLNAAKRAIQIKESWAEPYFYLAKGHYFLANRNENPPKNWQLCAQYAQFGMMLPITDTILFVNPLDRQVEIHRYMNVALNAMGRVKEALDSVNAALAIVPDDAQLLHNKKFYTAFLARHEVNEVMGKFKDAMLCGPEAYSRVMDILDGKPEQQATIFPLYFRSPEYPKDIKKEHFPAAITAPHSQAWAIPTAFEFDDLPLQLTDEQLQSVVLQVWKQYIANNEVISALRFLDKAPYRVRHTFATEQAMKMTAEMVSQNPVSIAFVDNTAIADHTYEKLADPVSQMIVPLKQKLERNGKMLLTTNNGSKDIDWSVCQDGTHWLERKKDDLSAPTTQSISRELQQAGYYVKDAFPVDNEIKVEAGLVAPAGYPKLDIVFWIGDGLEPWTPETAKRTGMGGSESMAIYLTKRLAALGHRVRVYAGCGKAEGIYDGVEYLLSNKFPGISCDVLVVSRYANMLSEDYSIKCKMKLLWCHDVVPVNGRNKFLLEAYRILALSEPHRESMLANYDIHPEHILTTRNGIDLKRFDKVVPRNRFKAINSSSPDRSWMFLFDVWPEIKKQVPAAELHLYYGFDNWEKLARLRGGGDMINIMHYKNRLREMEQYGVVFHGRVNQDELASEMLSAGCWLYPTAFGETSCCHPDTMISIPGNHINGPPRIRIIDLVGKENFPVWAFDEENQKFVIATCKKVWETKIATKLIKLTLDDGSILKLTPEHKMLNFDGEWVEAGNIQPETRLMALHHRYNVMIKDFDGNWESESRLVAEWKEGRKITSAEHVDHLDPTRLDNTPEMLQVLSSSDHAKKTHTGKQVSKLSLAKQVVGFKAWASEHHEELSQRGTSRANKWWNEIYPLMSEEERDEWNADRNDKRKEAHNDKMKDPIFAQEYIERQTERGRKGTQAFWDRIKAMPKEESAPILAERSRKANETKRNKKEAARLVTEQKHINNGQNHKVIKVEIIEETTPVYDMEVEKYHNFIAEGVVIHNCITAMEMQAAGVRMITSNIMALKETVGDRGVLIDGDAASKEYQAKFIEASVASMLNEDDSDRSILQQYAKEHFCLDQLAKDWDAMIYDLLGKMEEFPLVPYQPTLTYQPNKLMIPGVSCFGGDRLTVGKDIARTVREKQMVCESQHANGSL